MGGGEGRGRPRDGGASPAIQGGWRERGRTPALSSPHPPPLRSKKEADLKTRQAEARAWITPWLTKASGGAVAPKKPTRPAAEAAAPAKKGGNGAAGAKSGEALADGSVMYRF